MISDWLLDGQSCTQFYESDFPQQKASRSYLYSFLCVPVCCNYTSALFLFEDDSSPVYASCFIG